MQRDVNDIKTVFDEILVKFHWATIFKVIHQDFTAQNGASEEGTYVAISFASPSSD